MFNERDRDQYANYVGYKEEVEEEDEDFEFDALMTKLGPCPICGGELWRCIPSFDPHMAMSGFPFSFVGCYDSYCNFSTFEVNPDCFKSGEILEVLERLATEIDTPLRNALFLTKLMERYD